MGEGKDLKATRNHRCSMDEYPLYTNRNASRNKIVCLELSFRRTVRFLHSYHHSINIDFCSTYQNA
jgi:hypothetical protein